MCRFAPYIIWTCIHHTFMFLFLFMCLLSHLSIFKDLMFTVGFFFSQRLTKNKVIKTSPWCKNWTIRDSLQHANLLCLFFFSLFTILIIRWHLQGNCVTNIPAAVSDRCVASLWHVVGVRPSARGQLPGPNGRGRSGGRSRAEVQHGLLGKTLPFGAWAVLHLHIKERE